MLISHSHKFIYIHVYKAGGTSIKQAFEPYNAPSYRALPRKQKLIHPISFRPWIFSGQFPRHIKAAELQKQLHQKIFHNYLKFSFVRNPWSWILSHYTYALHHPGHHQHELFKSLGSFEAYLKWRINEEYICQKDFLYSKEGALLVDYAGKLETLNEDLSRICRRLGLPTAEIHHRNRSNPTGDFKTYYSEKTIQMVAEAWKDDIEVFGYRIPSIEQINS